MVGGNLKFKICIFAFFSAEWKAEKSLNIVSAVSWESHLDAKA